MLIHKDYNKSNNCLENLEWVTSSENNYHSNLNGRIKRDSAGKKNSNYRHGRKVILNIKRNCLYCKKEYIGKYINSLLCSRSCNCNYNMNTKSTIKEEMKLNQFQTH